MRTTIAYEFQKKICQSLKNYDSDRRSKNNIARGNYRCLINIYAELRETGLYNHFHSRTPLPSQRWGAFYEFFGITRLVRRWRFGANDKITSDT